MPENPYQSPTTNDGPAQARRSFVPKVYWGNVIASNIWG